MALVCRVAGLNEDEETLTALLLPTSTETRHYVMASQA